MRSTPQGKPQEQRDYAATTLLRKLFGFQGCCVDRELSYHQSARTTDFDDINRYPAALVASRKIFKACIINGSIANAA